MKLCYPTKRRAYEQDSDESVHDNGTGVLAQYTFKTYIGTGIRTKT